MNKDEKIAQEFLKKYDPNPIFEPDGNIPPDFIINNNIGIEVRRLNEHFFSNVHIKGLSNDSIPLMETIRTELLKYETSNTFYFISIQYKRHFGSLKKIKKRIQAAIKEFEANDQQIPYLFPINDNIKIEFRYKYYEETPIQKYQIGIESDMDSGGWIIPLYIENITHCIKEKKLKIKKNFSKYNSWWLILIDYIRCLDRYSIHEISKEIKKPTSFKKIIIIDATGQKLLLEI